MTLSSVKMSPMFPARQERLDWQLIAELEPLVLVGGCPEEIEKLQDVLAGLAFCSLEQEFGREMLEGTRGLAKIFRLSQLVIQYLIYCQVSGGWLSPSTEYEGIDIT